MGAKKAAYFLVHRETGQRYPIRSAVTIGRSRGDIVFVRDTKLSPQHCMVEPDSKGLLVKDMRSSTGTKIDGIPLTPDRVVLMYPTSELHLGDQAFTLQAVTRSSRIKKRPPSSSSNLFLRFLLLLILAGLIALHWQRGTFDRFVDSSGTKNQLAEIFENYQDLQMSFERQTAAPATVADRIQEKILARLAIISRRWANQSPRETEQNPKLAAQMKFVTALTAHAKAEMLFIRSGDTKYSDEIDQWTDPLEQATNDLRRFPGSQFPAFVVSPLQIVEREMRQALRDYRNLGDAARTRTMNATEIANKIHQSLVPKLTAVYSRLGAIAPQNDFERKKVRLELSLVAAVINQVKAMSLYNVSKDPKYAQELDRWSREIEKASTNLKQQVHPARRVPASDGH